MDPKELIAIESNFDSIAEAPIFDTNGVLVGWHATTLDKLKKPFGSGVGPDKDLSRRIAIAETIERAIFKKLFRENAQGFDFKSHPNTDGFACGFDKNATMIRAISEAVERWAWSQWIDEKKLLQSTPRPANLTELTQALLTEFDRVTFFKKRIPIVLGDHVLDLYFGVIIAETEDGVFPGSRVCTNEDQLWEHSAVEAKRNLNIYKNGTSRADLIYERIKYFGTNKVAAWDQINRAQNLEWGMPALKILKEVDDCPPGVFVWRAICNSYIDWFDGPIERFVY